MDIRLSPVEIRVLGSLMEKEVTTPDQYPLSLNALTTACNQKSNREPVMNLRDETVLDALDQLRRLRLAWKRHTTGGRVEKFAHGVGERFKLDRPELAVLTVLFLRGPQTAGEIRIRSGRMHDFEDPEAVEEVLGRLAEDPGGPFVTKLPRKPGTREDRWMHLLSGEPEQEATQEKSTASAEAKEEPPGEPPAESEEEQQRPTVRVRARGEEGRLEALERRVSQLRREIDEIKALLAEKL